MRALVRSVVSSLAVLVIAGCSPRDEPAAARASSPAEPPPERSDSASPADGQTDRGSLAAAPVLTDVEPVAVTESHGEVEEVELDRVVTETAFDSVSWNSAIGVGGGVASPGLGSIGGRMPPGREAYEAVDEHGYRGVVDHPLSTFAIDVDGASWSNARRFLEAGALPPVDAVRVEEFVNWFRYGDAPPAAGAEHGIALHTEVGPCAWQPEHRLLRVVLRTRDVDLSRLPPRNLVFLVDVSGSMRPADKLPLLKRGLRLLVRQMREQDRVAIVTYAGAARVALEPTSGARRAVIEAAIESLEAGGGTNGEGGIRMAYELARRSADAESLDRVVLATDGDFNVGISDRDELIRLIEHERDAGVFLSVLGFGTGNLQDATLESLGRHGNGQYAYIDSIAEARRVLVEQSGATLVTVAKDVKVQIEFNPTHVASYRQIGYENRALAARDFNDDRKDAGEMGAGHVVTALYELVPAGVTPPAPVVDPLRYQDPAPAATRPAAGAAAGADELLTVKVRYKHPDADDSVRICAFVEADLPAASNDDFRFASAVAAFGMLMRASPYVGTFDFEGVLELAQGARGDDPHGERAEFLKLVQMAADLQSTADRSR